LIRRLLYASRFGDPDERDEAAQGGTTVSAPQRAAATGRIPRLAVASEPVTWTRIYLRRLALADAICGLVAGALPIEARFIGEGTLPVSYLTFTLVLPALWCASMALAGGFEPRYFEAGSEFRRVLNAAVGLAVGVAIASYAFKIEFARSYVLIALPSVAVLDLAVRYGSARICTSSAPRGPRPALRDEVARYGDHMRRRLVVKPGITGLWHVSGRSGLSWEEAFRLDLRCVDNWSIMLDLQILCKSFSAVTEGSAAH
jgi:hypothetical protein